MKIRCDVCDIEDASVFCLSDEAALCDACDRHVHRANKLASKHHRLSLLSSTADLSLCDICQVRRAFLFCREDRAILCRECDITIHRANEHTQKHNRFLLIGVKIPSDSPSNSSDDDGDVVTTVASDLLIRPPPIENKRPSIGSEVEDREISDGVSYSRSSISEYLDSLPGWCVEEFLDPTSAANAFCEV